MTEGKPSDKFARQPTRDEEGNNDQTITYQNEKTKHQQRITTNSGR
jgi:hypothetical protein